jgi:GrpB-like predicted nucleotidyltransferase (UPF0157 family)
VELADPDPAWAARYAAEAERIRAALAGMEPAIEHIGSTAVPLRAKPIVDIQVGVDEPARAVAALGALGYAHHGQGGIPGREYLTRREPAFNVHVFARANPVLRDNLRLRDHLRAHPAAAAEYARAKEAALAGGARDLDSYSDAKRAAVTALLEAARRAGGSGPTSC